MLAGVIRTIKEEEVYLNDYRDLREAQENLGYLTPSEFETQWRVQRRREIEAPGGNA